MTVHMDIKENLLRAIAHDSPDHVPYYNEGGLQVLDFEGHLPPVSGLDLWGVRWETTRRELMPYIVDHPLKNAEDLLAYPFPDAHKPGLFDGARQKIDKAHCLTVGRHIDAPFLRYWTILGMENALTLMLTDPDTVQEFMNRLVDWNIEIANGYMSIGTEAVRISDDYGSERDLMISPTLWRKMIKPPLTRLVQHYKQAGRIVILHSCGRIMSIMDDLVEIGIDVFNIQTIANDLPALKRRFDRKITFQGGVASQIMNLGTPDDVRHATLVAIKELAPGGGLMLEPDQTMVMRPENVEALLDTVREYGRYPLDL